MKRVASVIGIAPDPIEAYEALHADAWPAILERLTASSIHNYSIYRYAELLFSYFEYSGEDFEADMAAVAEDPETQRWWDICKPMQRPVADRAEGEWWKGIVEVFHLD